MIHKKIKKLIISGRNQFFSFCNLNLLNAIIMSLISTVGLYLFFGGNFLSLLGQVFSFSTIVFVILFLISLFDSEKIKEKMTLKNMFNKASKKNKRQQHSKYTDILRKQMEGVNSKK